jgi:hypothetical protein
MSDMLIKSLEWLDEKVDSRITEYYHHKFIEEQNDSDENRFNKFIESFNNPYAKDGVGSNKVDEFNKQLIRKFATYLSLDNIYMAMSGIKSLSMYTVFNAIFEESNNKVKLNTDTIFVASPWSGGNLTGNTNAYRGVVGSGFVQDPHGNHKGFYFKDLDIAFVYNGNHSISLGTIINDIDITTNSVFPSGNLKQDFFNATITFNSIEINGESYSVDWKLAVLLYMIQQVYRP